MSTVMTGMYMYHTVCLFYKKKIYLCHCINDKLTTMYDKTPEKN